MRRVPALIGALALVAAVLPALPALSAPSVAVARPAGPTAADTATVASVGDLDLDRPRILLRDADIPVVQERLTREPYRTLLRGIGERIAAAPPPSAADQAECMQSANREREGAKAKAAKDAAFLYAIDRVWDPVAMTVVQPDAAARQALGDLARDHLRFMCPHSRIKVQIDRDINTSHELAQLATAFDTLAGTGYDFGPHRATAVANLTAQASEFYGHYAYPDDYGGLVAFSGFLVNNHRSKGAASIGLAALALAGEDLPAGDPKLVDPDAWLDFGLDRVDLVQRHTYGTADGAYGEGGHYWRFAALNVVPFLRAYDTLAGGRSWRSSSGLVLPSLWRHPQFAAMQHWIIDTASPDGTVANFDDSNPGEGFWFGAFPADFPGAEQFAWRWSQGADPYAVDASIDLAPDQIVTFDDGVTPAEPTGSPSAFYPEGGNAVFRSDWGPDALLTVIQGEHEAAREFGRLRDGRGEAYSAAHDQADPGSFQLHRFGERLLLDPGYVNFPWTEHWVLNKPSDHNMILVAPPGQPGESPRDPLTSSVDFVAIEAWTTTPGLPTPTDGEAYLTGLLDSPALDAATVTSSYGQPAADVRRRFLSVGDDVLVIADEVRSPTARTFTWPWHGNAGGADGVRPTLPALTPDQRPLMGAAALPAEPYTAAGGAFTETATGATWERSAARVTVGSAFAGATPAREVTQGFHEIPPKKLAQHDVLRLAVTGTEARAVSLVVPTRIAAATPVIAEVPVVGGAGLVLDDPGGDRRMLVVSRPAGAGHFEVDGVLPGAPALRSDGSLVVLEVALDGAVRAVHAEDASVVTLGGVDVLRAPGAGVLSLRLADTRAEVVADTPGGTVAVAGLAFAPDRADGACGLEATPDGAVLALGHERRVTLRAGGAPSAPGADPGPDRTTAAGPVVLDADGSCDLDGGVLTHEWRVVAAPPGSGWRLDGAAGPTPVLDASVPGRYRVVLVSTDATGSTSLEAELVLDAVAPPEPAPEPPPSAPVPPSTTTTGPLPAPVRAPRFTG